SPCPFDGLHRVGERCGLGYGLFGIEPWGVSGFWWGLIVGFGVSTLTLNTRLAIMSRSDRRIRRYAEA
ncbi:MAG: hypothetical protein OXP09_18015, partial [Gammaproteobacteria bacterium]|nr:hypothetical protein [Gammaproteobacteria bacterium]